MTAPLMPAKAAGVDAISRGVEAAWRAMWAPGEPTSPAPTEAENPLLWCQVRAIVAAVVPLFEELQDRVEQAETELNNYQELAALGADEPEEEGERVMVICQHGQPDLRFEIDHVDPGHVVLDPDQ